MDVDQGELIKCPLNPIHLVRRSRMDYHLIRCKKQYGDQNMVKCPFNAGHLVASKDLEKHKSTCPAHANCHRGMLKIAEETAVYKRADSSSNTHDSDEEDWGSGPEVIRPPIQIGKNPYSYLPGAMRRQKHLDELEAFKAKMSSAENRVKNNDI